MLSPTSGIKDILGDAAGGMREIIRDPALPRFIQQIGELHALEQTDPSTTVRTSSGTVPGVGLTEMTRLVDLYIMYRKRKKVIIGIGIGLVVGIGFVGYLIGKK